MMRKTLLTFMLSVAVIGTSAWAETTEKSKTSTSENCSGPCNKEYKKKPIEPSSSAGEPGMASTAEASEITRGYLKDEKIGIKPQLGVLAYTDQAGENTARAAYGFTLDANIAKMIDNSWNKTYLGITTGFLFSHLGAPGSNIMGADPSNNQGTAGANMFLIPANLKAAYNVYDNFRVGLHGGGNVVYRSIASVSNFGDSSSLPGSVWRLFPNVGADFELELSEHAALMLRPDWTLTPGTNFFMGTLALSIPLT